jgi:hypothetical protein
MGGESEGAGQAEGGTGGFAPCRRGKRILNEPKAVSDAYDLARWLLTCASKFPKEYRFTLGERTHGATLDVLEHLTSAAYSTDKTEDLQEANRALQRTRILVRLARDLGMITERQYEFATPKIVELGKQIGGWRKQQEKGGGRTGKPEA